MIQRVFCHRVLRVVAAGWLAVFCMATMGRGQEPLPPGSDPDGVESLTQGPIHEAFANPTDLDPTPGPVVATQPPEDIREEPPEFMPEDSTWIGGYWSWDEEQNEFLWVTGVARKSPPGMRYVPGYWTEATGGWQRVSGFWASADVGEIAYRQPPPNSLEAGPSSPSPADNYFWVPGSWNYYDTGYRWRGGYWTPYQPDWVWVPARWVWTPGGCVYLAGFWDFQLSFRGQFFAPIRFVRPVYRQPQFVYRPWCVIPTTNLFIHLWVRPNHCHYYFGNYYGPRYAGLGYQSWCHAPPRRHYDPFFTYASVHYRRQGVDFVGRVQGWHDHYERHEDHRPQRTWHEQQQFVRKDLPRGSLETQLVARNITEVAQRGDGPVRLTKVDQRSRQEFVARNEKMRELNVSRKKVEHEAAQVVAKLPLASGARNDDRGSKGGREGRGPSFDRPNGKGPPPDGNSPSRNVNVPKFQLPKDTAATAIVRSGEPRGGKSMPKIDGSPNGKSRPTATRRETVPPPMPADGIVNDNVPPPTRGKGREPGADKPPVVNVDPLPKSKLPKLESPDRDGPPGNVGKGKGKMPKIDPPKIDDAPPGNSGKTKGKAPSIELSKPGDAPADTAPRGKARVEPPKFDPPKTELPKGSPVDPTPRRQFSRPPEDVKPNVKVKPNLDVKPTVANPPPQTDNPALRRQTSRPPDVELPKPKLDAPPNLEVKPDISNPPRTNIRPPKASDGKAKSSRSKGKTAEKKP